MQGKNMNKGKLKKKKENMKENQYVHVKNAHVELLDPNWHADLSFSI